MLELWIWYTPKMRDIIKKKVVHPCRRRRQPPCDLSPVDDKGMLMTVTGFEANLFTVWGGLNRPARLQAPVSKPTSSYNMALLIVALYSTRLCASLCWYPSRIPAS